MLDSKANGDTGWHHRLLADTDPSFWKCFKCVCLHVWVDFFQNNACVDCRLNSIHAVSWIGVAPGKRQGVGRWTICSEYIQIFTGVIIPKCEIDSQLQLYC